jgi:hypothetical protein
MNRIRFLLLVVMLALLVVAAPASSEVQIGRPALGHTAEERDRTASTFPPSRWKS